MELQGPPPGIKSQVLDLKTLHPLKMSAIQFTHLFKKLTHVGRASVLEVS